MSKRGNGKLGSSEGGKSGSPGGYGPDGEADKWGCSGGETAKCACGKHRERTEERMKLGVGRIVHETLGGGGWGMGIYKTVRVLLLVWLALLLCEGGPKFHGKG